MKCLIRHMLGSIQWCVFITGIAAVVDLCTGKCVRGVMNVMDTDISKLSFCTDWMQRWWKCSFNNLTAVNFGIIVIWKINHRATCIRKSANCSVVVKLLRILCINNWSNACYLYSSSSLSSVSLCWRWGFDKPSPSASTSGQNCCCC